MKNVIQALEKAGIRQKTRVMIGGAPITQQYADEIGADGYSDNAGTAVALARKPAYNKLPFSSRRHGGLRRFWADVPSAAKRSQ